MTADRLAAIAAAIDNDMNVEAANWPLSRERARAYLALGRAAVGLVDAMPGSYAPMVPDRPDLAYVKVEDMERLKAALVEASAALSAIAPAPEVPDATP